MTIPRLSPRAKRFGFIATNSKHILDLIDSVYEQAERDPDRMTMAFSPNRVNSVVQSIFA
jgi:hypothetical protein